ncbi:hypothetical protein D3C77_246200 [compost metagenome]
MRNYFRIAGCLKDGAALLQLMTDLRGIDDVAVRSYREISIPIFKNQRLRIHQTGVPVRGITDMPNGTVAMQRAQSVPIEHFLHEPHAPVIIELLTVRYA